MAVYTIATIGSNPNDKGLFDIAKKSLAQELNPEDSINFVDITGKSEAEILAYGAFQSVMYFNDIHSTDDAQTLSTVLNIGTKESNNFQILPLSHKTVTTKERQQENEILQSYLESPANINSYLVSIDSEHSMEALSQGILKSAALSYFDIADPEHAHSEMLLDDFINIIEEATDIKHDYTAGHVYRVSKYSEELAKQMGLTDKEVEEVSLAARLHDIGKIATPDNVLGKAAALTYGERVQMDYHSSMGAGLLEAIVDKNPNLARNITPTVIEAIANHHKDWDGYHDRANEGKPEFKDPINGDAIGKYALIIATADCIDAMTSQRAYNNPKHILDTFRDLWVNRGKQFKPEIAESAIVMIGKEIASLGIDPTLVVPEDGKRDFKHVDNDLKAFIEKNKDNFEVARDVSPETYSKLGFRLDSQGYFEFIGKNPPVRDTQIRYDDEYDFKLGKFSRDNNIPRDAITDEQKSNIQDAIRRNFADQDRQGIETMSRARTVTRENIEQSFSEQYSNNQHSRTLAQNILEVVSDCKSQDYLEAGNTIISAIKEQQQQRYGLDNTTKEID